MATGEDQSQAIIFNALVLRDCGLTRLSFQLRGIESGAAAQGVNRFKAARGNQPGSSVLGHTGLRPLSERCGEGIMHRVLGKIEIAQQTDECGENAARLRAINGVEHLAYVLSGIQMEAI